MLKKIPCLLFLIALNCKKISAQNFMHSVGANISLLTANIETPYVKGSFAMMVNHLSYFPRLLVMESENSSLSFGSPLGVGINIIDDVTGTSGIAWGFDVPLVVDYNMGCKSAPDNENGFGGYFGAGFGYMYTNYTFGNGTEKANSYGPLARAGIRFSSGDSRWFTTVGIYYKQGLEPSKFKTFGFNVFMDF